MLTLEITHAELALLIRSLAHAQSELGLFSDRFVAQYKIDLDQLIRKLEGQKV